MFAGVAGGAGGNIAGGAGVDVTMLASLALTGGAGGGSVAAVPVDFGGGSVIGAGPYQTLAGGAAAGGPGLLGYSLLKPFVPSGGSGGGTNGIAGVGGAGGAGGYGCGGGGGGGGITGGTGGAGGDGIVFFEAW